MRFTRENLKPSLMARLANFKSEQKSFMVKNASDRWPRFQIISVEERCHNGCRKSVGISIAMYIREILGLSTEVRQGAFVYEGEL